MCLHESAARLFTYCYTFPSVWSQSLVIAYSLSPGRGAHPAGSHEPARLAAPVSSHQPPTCLTEESSKQKHPLERLDNINVVEIRETEAKKKLDFKYLHSYHLRGTHRSIFCPHFPLFRDYDGFLLLLQLQAGNTDMKRCSYCLETLFPIHPRCLYTHNRPTTATLHPRKTQEALLLCDRFKRENLLYLRCTHKTTLLL